MNKPDLILIGAGGHARSCIDVIEQHGEFNIAGLVGVQDELNDRHFGYEVIATDSEFPELVEKFQYALVAVGQIRTADNRIRIYREAVRLGFRMPAIVSPSATVSRHAVLGAGTIVMHGAIINAGVEVGDNCIINSRALLEHDVKVENHCHISTGAILNGSAKIGRGSFVGSGSVVKEGVRLGKGCIVGMGLSVRHDQQDFTRFAAGVKA